jgi:4-amino-4-deoxy-L-arabinose transferase-like glycosyltransferase
LSQLIIPTAWAITPILYGGDPGSPYARPDLKTLKTSAAYFYFEKREKREYEKLLSFLEKNNHNEKYVSGVNGALFCGSDLVLFTDGRIMSLGGFNGFDPIVSGDTVSEYVKSEEIRFFLIRHGFRISKWIAKNGKIVPNKEWKNPGDLEGYALYDLKPE